jgi:hypothetical protein
MDPIRQPDLSAAGRFETMEPSQTTVEHRSTENHNIELEAGDSLIY